MLRISPWHCHRCWCLERQAITVRWQGPHANTLWGDVFSEQSHFLHPFDRRKQVSSWSWGAVVYYCASSQALYCSGGGSLITIRAGQVTHVAPCEWELCRRRLCGRTSQSNLSNFKHKLPFMQQALAKTRVMPSWAHLWYCHLRWLTVLAWLEESCPSLVGSKELTSTQTTTGPIVHRLNLLLGPQEPQALVSLVMDAEKIILKLVKLWIGEGHGCFQSDGSKSHPSCFQPSLHMLGVHSALNAVDELFERNVFNHPCDACLCAWSMQVAVGNAHWSHLW